MENLSTTRPRVALVGVNGYARIYCDYLYAGQGSGRLSVVALAVLPEEREASFTSRFAQSGARIFERFEDLVAFAPGNIDISMVPTGIHWHAKMVTALLRAGSNVLVEKPLAGCLADAESILRAEAETGHWVAVGFQDVYSPEIRKLKKRLVQGVIGPLKSVSVLGLWPRSRGYFSRNNWAGKLRVDNVETRDSPMNNALAHFVNLAMYLAGDAVDETVDLAATEGALYRANPIESFDTAIVLGTSTGGVRFWFGVSHACSTLRDPVIYIRADHGEMEWRHGEGYKIWSRGQVIESGEAPDYAITRNAMFESVCSHLFDPDRFIYTAKMASWHTAFIESIHSRFGIISLPESMIRIESSSDGLEEVSTIIGLEAAMEEAYRDGIVLHLTPSKGL